MSSVVQDSGLKTGLDLVLAGPLTMRLFENNVTPWTGSVLSDFNVATFPGYLDQDAAAGLPAATIDITGRAVVQGPPITFTRGAGVGVYSVWGWLLFFTVGLSSRLFAAEVFSAPRVLDTAGQTLIFSPLYYVVRA